MKEMVKLISKVKDEVKNTDDFESSYTFNGVTVPRVTKILSKCIHSDGLMYWANSLGFKHQSYSKTLQAAADIGTVCHNGIDKFMDDNSYTMEPTSPIDGYNAFMSFRKWFDDINLFANVEVVFHEKTLVCAMFGGTIDGLYKINGRYYLIDYKTSNHITYKYCLQVAAYRYMLRVLLGIEIDGVIILQLSKKNISYNEYVLNFDNLNHLYFINDCERAFMSLVYAYYNIAIIENSYKNINWEVK